MKNSFSVLRGMLLILCGLLTNVYLYAQYNSYNGIVAGKFTVLPSGASQYSVQIDLPPGNAGATPSLSIAYSSQNGNGLLGTGWALSGLTSISRSGATVPEDGFRGGVNFDANDRFVLDGQRLMNTAGNNSTYFNPGNSYYTETQSWSRTVANGTAGQGPASFTVTMKDGSVAQFGNGNGSQALAQGPAFNSGSLQGSVQKWMISQYTNTIGNNIAFFYNKAPRNINGQRMNGSIPDGFPYADYIAWGSNNGSPNNRILQFLYEPRQDTLQQYSGGSFNQVSVRLKAVTTFVIEGNDTTPVKTYMFNYDPASPFGISRLSSITTLGSKGGSSLPLSLQWTDGATGLVPNTINWNGPRLNTGYLGDFNGDGKTDLLPVSNNSIGGLWLSTSNGFSQQPISPSILTTQQSYVSDFNGDGLPDLLVLRPTSTQLYLCNGNGFNSAIQGPALNYNASCSTCISIADFNGDGMTDVFTFSANSSNVYIANGKGFNSAVNSTMSLPPASTFVADINGDDQADVFTAGIQGGNLYLSGFSQNNTFNSPIPISGINLSNTPQNNMLADYNKDGLTDLLIYFGSQYTIYYSNGKGFSPPNPITNISLQGSQNWMSDFNGDGYIDLYTLTGTKAVIYYFSAGKFYPQNNSSPAFIAADTWSGDFNGDGIADLFAANQSSISFGGNAASGTVPSVNQKPFLLTSISNGIGGNIAMNYMPISNPAVYTPLSNNTSLVEGLRTQNHFNSIPLAPVQVAAYPYVSTQSATYVTSSYSLSDGMGNTYPYTYQYSGSLQDMQAYGWLGFQQVTKTDPGAGNILRTQFLQPYPTTGKPIVTDLLSLNNTLLRRNRTSYKVVTGQAGNNYQVLKTATRTDHYDYGNFTYTTGANYAYDNYGNQTIEEQLNDTSEPSNRIFTVSQYLNDTQGWHIGYKTANILSTDTTAASALQQYRYTYNTQSWLPSSSSTWLNTNNSWLTTSYTYDMWGNTITTISPSGDTSRNTYDNTYHTFPVSSTSPPNQWGSGLTINQTYDPGSGLLLSATDANGNTFRTYYDQFGRDSVLTGPDSSNNTVVLSRLGYYRNQQSGFVNTKMQRNNWKGTSWDSSAYSFDGLARNIMQSWNGISGQTVFQSRTFNGNNQPVNLGLACFSGDKPQAVTITYDPYKRPVAVSIPGPQQQTVINSITYSGKQIVVLSDSGTANAVKNSRNFDYYNGKVKVVKKTDPSGLTTNYTYDPLARNTGITDPAGLQTSYSYYSTNDLLNSVNPAAGKTTFLRNYIKRNGALVSNNGDTIFYQQDALNRKLSVSTRFGNQLFQYDVTGVQNGMGNLCKVQQSDNKLSYSYAYDAYGNPTQVSTALNGKTFTEKGSYNPSGNISFIQYPDGDVAQYSYYNNGYLQQIGFAAAQQSLQTVLSCNQYDADGDQLLLTYGNQVQRKASFNPFGLLASYTISNGSGQTLASKNYSWNGLFRITGIADNLNNANSEQYSYAPNGRLLTVSAQRGTDNYSYDNAGNLSSGGSTSYTTNNQYQVTGAAQNGNSLFSAGYDANGNMVWKNYSGNGKNTNAQYRYDAFNQLAAILSGTDTLQAYAYNYSGQRVLQRDNQAGISTAYISPHYSMSWNNGQQSAAKYICTPEQIIASVKKSGEITYFHQNFINTTLLTTNPTGNTNASWNYHPYGGVLSASGADSTNSYLFSGRELDRSGLYYFNARYYDPATGRFITADNQPGGSRFHTDSYNRYAYALNDPVRNYDPSGHNLEDVFAVDWVMDAALDIVTLGAAAPLDPIFDAAVDEVGLDFLKSLAQGREANRWESYEGFDIFHARRFAIDRPNGLTEAARLAQPGAKFPVSTFVQAVDGTLEPEIIPGQDAYGNSVYGNRDAGRLGTETIDRTNMVSNTPDAWAQNNQDIARILNSNVDKTYKFTLSFDNYQLRIGDDILKHAAIEGAGRDVYTAGTVTRRGNGTLEITNNSGHYKPSLKSNYLADPLWRSLNRNNGLNFTRIIYTSVR